MPIELHEVHPLVGFVVVLLAVIAYRFIPPDKTIDSRLLIPLAGTLKRGGEPNFEVHVRIAMMVLVSLVVLISSLYTITFRLILRYYSKMGIWLRWHHSWLLVKEIIRPNPCIIPCRDFQRGAQRGARSRIKNIINDSQ